MGLLERISRVIRATINSLIGEAEDPEKLLEQTVLDMQSDLMQLRQAVAQAIATQKRTERQHRQTETAAQDWYERAQLAMERGDESLAREALERRHSYKITAVSMAEQLEQQRTIVTKLKQDMRTLEHKINDAKTKKDMYLARVRSAQASQRINEMMGQLNNKGSLSAFEKMENRILELEAQSEALASLDSDSVEEKFTALESSEGVDAEFAALKAKTLAAHDPGATHSPSNPPSTEENAN